MLSGAKRVPSNAGAEVLTLPPHNVLDFGDKVIKEEVTLK